MVEDVRELIEQSHQRGIRVIADLVMNHTSSDHAWFQESRSSPDSPKRDWYVWSDTVHRYEDARIIFIDTESLELDVGRAGRGVLLAPLLLPPARPQLRQPRGPGGDARGPALLARPRPRRLPARRHPVPDRARGHQRREPPGDARVPQARARRGRRPLPGPGAARRGQPVAGGRRGVLRRRRRVPHVLPLPGHAAPVHERAPGGGDADVRDPRAHAGHPGELPVGPLPPQPRRAHARDGHGRGARLHVRGVRQGPAHEAQPRDPPPARAAARQRARRDRAHARHPVLAARLPGALLRRRDRDGGQRLPRRPRRRAHADAVDGRPQRRLLAGGLRPALRAAAHGPGVRLPGRQRRGPAAHADEPAALAAPLHLAAQGAPRVRLRHVRAAHAEQPADLRPRAPLRGRRDAVRAQPRALGPGGRARPVRVRSGRHPVEIFGRSHFPSIGQWPYLLTLAPRGFYWFQLVEDEAKERPMPDAAGLLAALPEERLHEWILDQRWFALEEPRVAHFNVLEAVALPAGPAAARRSRSSRRTSARGARGLPGADRPPPGRRGLVGARDLRRPRRLDGLRRARRSPRTGASCCTACARSTEVGADEGTLSFRWAESADPGAGGTVDVRPVARRAVELLDHLRRRADPQGVPPARAGRQPRARDAAVPVRARASRTSRRWSAGTSTRAG